ncbi:MAG: glycosyltransferase family 4 protein [Anaerolineae bacterium]|nr:glycosyltransferase family 4 protein [Anaerolineae bacterium]
MRIAFISQPWDDIIPPVQGGSLGIWTYQVARRCTDWADIVVYSRQAPSQAAVQVHEQIEYRRVPTTIEDTVIKPLKISERVVGHLNPKRPFFSSSFYYLGYGLQIAKDLRRQPCDVIHIFNFSQFVPILKAANPHAKIVLHMHCEWLTQLDPKRIASRLEKVDLILGCSDYITQKIREQYPQFADRCATVYNGVDFNHFEAKNGHRTTKSGQRLLFVGRVSPEKGVHVLLEAFEKVAQQHPDVYLDIVGPVGSAPYEFMVLVSDDKNVAELASFYHGRMHQSDYGADLKDHMTSRFADRVNFVGPINHSQTIDYYHQADILINPSLTEAFGMSLVEAMASKLPVVASRVGGMTEIVREGESGLLFAANDSTALAEAIAKLLNDTSLRTSMGKTGHDFALSRYSWDQVAQSLQKHLNGMYA